MEQYYLCKSNGLMQEWWMLEKPEACDPSGRYVYIHGFFPFESLSSRREYSVYCTYIDVLIGQINVQETPREHKDLSFGVSLQVSYNHRSKLITHRIY